MDYTIMSSVGCATTFPQFGKLSPKICCQIWRYSKSGPRLVAIKYHRNTTSYRACIPTPELLRVNRESRHEGLRIYHELRLGPYANTSCYVDPTQDTVYLKSDLERATDSIVNPANIHPGIGDVASHLNAAQRRHLQRRQALILGNREMARWLDQISTSVSAAIRKLYLMTFSASLMASGFSGTSTLTW
jgi:hypothetical protein